MLLCSPVILRISKPVAITSPACPKRICWRLPARALAARSQKEILKDKGTFSAAGVATGFETMNDRVNITIGKRDEWGEPRSFGIAPIDPRQHGYIIGKTG